MKDATRFSPELLDIDCAAELERISGAIRDALGRTLRKRGLVVGISARPLFENIVAGVQIALTRYSHGVSSTNTSDPNHAPAVATA